MTNHDHPPLDLFHELRLLRHVAICKYGRLGDNYRTLGALRLEYREVEEAIQDGRDIDIRAELLDLVTVALRRVIEMDAEAEV